MGLYGKGIYEKKAANESRTKRDDAFAPTNAFVPKYNYYGRKGKNEYGPHGSCQCSDRQPQLHIPGAKLSSLI